MTTPHKTIATIAPNWKSRFEAAAVLITTVVWVVTEPSGPVDVCMRVTVPSGTPLIEDVSMEVGEAVPCARNPVFDGSTPDV
jgi:hypothetical protein